MSLGKTLPGLYLTPAYETNSILITTVNKLLFDQNNRWTRFRDKFLRHTLPITRQNGSASSLGVTVVVCKTSEGLECGTKFVDFELASVSKVVEITKT